MNLIERIAKFRAEQLTMREKGKGRQNGRETQLERVRRICATMPSVRKNYRTVHRLFLSRGQGVFTMFVDNHHEDGHRAIWLPARRVFSPRLSATPRQLTSNRLTSVQAVGLVSTGSNPG